MSCIKFIGRQANTIILYKNLRPKLLKCCANIYFNKQCLSKTVIPEYDNTKFANTSPAAYITTKKTQITRVKDEVKFLFKKKEKLKHELYKAHLKAAQKWGECGGPSLTRYMNHSTRKWKRKYNSLDKKISKLVQTQTIKSSTNTQFYPRVVKKTNIHFTDEELTLLNKGLK